MNCFAKITKRFAGEYNPPAVTKAACELFHYLAWEVLVYFLCRDWPLSVCPSSYFGGNLIRL
jgi:hypothetical protein